MSLIPFLYRFVKNLALPVVKFAGTTNWFCLLLPGIQVIRVTTTDGSLLRYKVHLVISKTGFPFTAGMTTARIHDSQYFPFLKHDNFPECELLADRGYISAGQQLALFQQAGVRIITALKANMKIKNL